MIPLHRHLPLRALSLRLRVNHPGGPNVDPGVYEGVVFHVDRLGSGVLDSLELRLDDEREIHVPGGTPGQVVSIIVERSAA